MKIKVLQALYIAIVAMCLAQEASAQAQESCACDTVTCSRAVCDTIPCDTVLCKDFLQPVLGIRTNLIYDCTFIPGYGFTSVPSIGMEYYPENGKITLGGDVEFPHWRHWDEHRFLQIYNITLEGRYYFKPRIRTRYNGLYALAELNGARYGIGFDADRGWQGAGLGLSAGVGYKLPVGNSSRSRLTVDFGIAAGAFYTRYDPYVYGNDATGWYYYDFYGDPSAKHKRNESMLWGGPVRAWISVGWDIFDRGRRREDR